MANWQNWKPQEETEEIEEIRSDWNIKKEQLKNLSDKMMQVQNAIAWVKVYKKDWMIRILPMIEVTYGLIKHPLQAHFKQSYDDIEWGLNVARHYHQVLERNWLYSKNAIITEDVKNFVESLEYLYDCLNKAVYSMGLGLSFNKSATMEDKIGKALNE